MALSCDENIRLLCHKNGPKYKDDWKQTEMKAQVTVSQQHQQAPGRKQLQPQGRNKYGTVCE